MFPVIDLIATVGGLVVPPVFDFIKKKFIKEENDTVERTIGSLATTKPEVLPEYINALTGAKKAEVEFFNRDVVGTPSAWVIDLRASIRPATVALGIVSLCLMAMLPERINIPPDIRYFLEVNISSWFGSKLKE
jgi:hypothetical protein